MKTNKLFRNPVEGKIGGVAAGFADYFELDVTLVRVAMILAIFLAKCVPVVLIYIIFWIVLPKTPTVSSSSNTVEIS